MLNKFLILDSGKWIVVGFGKDTFVQIYSTNGMNRIIHTHILMCRDAPYIVHSKGRLKICMIIYHNNIP
jgi:hypothetical protein